MESQWVSNVYKGLTNEIHDLPSMENENFILCLMEVYNTNANKEIHVFIPALMLTSFMSTIIARHSDMYDYAHEAEVIKAGYLGRIGPIKFYNDMPLDIKDRFITTVQAKY